MWWTCEGFISMDEFEEACRLLGQHTASVIPREHVIAMARNMDLNKDGHHLQTARRTTCQQGFFAQGTLLFPDSQEIMLYSQQGRSDRL